MNDIASLLIDAQCSLGEGPFWHPGRQRLFWFDIDNQILFAATADGVVDGQWHFNEIAAAAAIIDDETLAIATETGLKRLNLATGAVDPLIDIETDVPANRTNDSRVHPSGAFWIGTMQKSEEQPGGAVYHYRAGRLTKIVPAAKIPNATCFSPDGRIAYWTDTPTKKIMQCKLDPQTGLPDGEWTLFADVSNHRGYPDGAVVDSQGYLWNARWGGSCVVRHAPDGAIDRVVEVPVSQVTCPAFGGKDLKRMFITTANKTMSAEQRAAEKVAGGVFYIDLDIAGQTETPILL